MRRRLALLAALLAIAGVAAAGPAAPALYLLSVPMGQPPPPGASVVGECHGSAPDDLGCSFGFPAGWVSLRTSSCDVGLSECSRFTGKIRMSMLDNTTRPDVYDCNYVAGLQQGCATYGRADGIRGDVTLVVEILPRTVYRNPVPGSPSGGAWHVWASVG